MRLTEISAVQRRRNNQTNLADRSYTSDLMPILSHVENTEENVAQKKLNKLKSKSKINSDKTPGTKILSRSSAACRRQIMPEH